MKLKVVTLCSGYDSQCMALDVLRQRHHDFDYELVAWSEIDKYAIEMHNLVYPQWADRNCGDMTKIDWQPIKDKWGEIDILTYSTPCQDISQAGKQNGLTEGSGTRSAILWSTEEAIRILKPKYLLQENVKAIISGFPKLVKIKDGKEIPTFWSECKKWMDRVESHGYRNDWAIINAKNMGVPQNRERFFLLSQRNDIAKEYHFPTPKPLDVTLEDILEDEVDEKYFLKDDAVGKFLKANDKDDAVFVQISLPPRHEDAMFVKTWFNRLMNKRGGWSMKPTELEAMLTDARDTLFPWDWRSSSEIQDEGFKEEYCMNLTEE